MRKLDHQDNISVNLMEYVMCIKTDKALSDIKALQERLKSASTDAEKEKIQKEIQNLYPGLESPSEQ